VERHQKKTCQKRISRAGGDRSLEFENHSTNKHRSLFHPLSGKQGRNDGEGIGQDGEQNASINKREELLLKERGWESQGKTAGK